MSIRDLLTQHKLFLPAYHPGTYRLVCPKCRGGSTHEKSLAVTVNEDGRSAAFICHRATCGHAGRLHVDQQTAINDAGYLVSPSNRKRKEEPIVRPKPKFESLTPEMITFFASRGITESTLQRNGISAETVWIPGENSQGKVIAFPYYRDSAVVNIKYRTLNKKFWQVKGAEKVLYGLDDVDVDLGEIIIVEGEMDKLALEEAGFRNVVSVPDGAPARVKDGDLPPVGEDTKFSYLWTCRAWLDPAVKVIIATDNDAPGEALAEELARRLGRERCWRVRWPFSKIDHRYVAGLSDVDIEMTVDAAGGSGTLTAEQPGEDGAHSTSHEGAEGAAEGANRLDPQWYRKDANEVLMRDGRDLLRAFIDNADPLPIRGLLKFSEYYDDIWSYYYLQLKDNMGYSTGWPSLDKFYRVIPGELTIVTGVPNSGKSEWLDGLMANLTELHGWTFAMCSMEKKATDHARQLIEKYTGKPFFDLPYSRGLTRMQPDDLEKAIDWMDSRFYLIRYEDDELPSVDWVLDIARAAVYRYGIRGLVIDPYNELDHRRPASMNETEYVSQMLTKVKRFAQTAGVHVWFVAHPRQLREWKGQAPNLYDISGSAHFINKADNGIVVHRNRDPQAQNQFEVQVLVRKVRNKAAGTTGECVLHYERANGRYSDPGSDPGSAPVTARPLSSVMGYGAVTNGQYAASSDRGELLMTSSNGNSSSSDAYPSSYGQTQTLRSKFYQHPDGSVNSFPPDAEFLEEEENML